MPTVCYVLATPRQERVNIEVAFAFIFSQNRQQNTTLLLICCYKAFNHQLVGKGNVGHFSHPKPSWSCNQSYSYHHTEYPKSTEHLNVVSCSE